MLLTIYTFYTVIFMLIMITNSTFIKVIWGFILRNTDSTFCTLCYRVPPPRLNLCSLKIMGHYWLIFNIVSTIFFISFFCV